MCVCEKQKYCFIDWRSQQFLVFVVAGPDDKKDAEWEARGATWSRGGAEGIREKHAQWQKDCLR